MKKASLAALLLLALVAVFSSERVEAQDTRAVLDTTNATVQVFRATRLPDGGIHVMGECQVPYLDGGFMERRNGAEIAGATRTTILTFMDGPAKNLCKPR